MASRDTKTNILQEESVRFKATIGLNKKIHQGDVSVYVENVDIISVRQMYKEPEGKHDKKRRAQTFSGCAQACWRQ
jgi:hypothetical protein